MLEKLHLENFKCFRQQDIVLKPLTILSGINSTGKSTIIESLLLLRYSYLNELNTRKFQLRLNNIYGKYGRGTDVLCDDADNNDIGINLFCEKERYFQGKWLVKKNSTASVLNPIEKHSFHKNFFSTALFSNNQGEYIDFAFLSAERLGPRSSFDISDENTEKIGIHGEYAAFYFDIMQARDIAFPKIADIGESSDLSTQVNKWMRYISPGFDIKTNVQTEIDTATLGYVADQGAASRRPINVGFGLTYTFPVILALLTVRKNGLLILENPEAHLHPKAQTVIGRLVAKAVQNGAQIILETHSDHIINGIRVAVKKQILDSQKVGINFFSMNPRVIEPIMTEIHIENNGKLDTWPKDFLSEWEDNLFKLL